MSAGVARNLATRQQLLWLCGLALALRLLVVAVAVGRFPAADDGAFYHQVALRIARGEGYTWAWPDGTVTYAAHYPVGYPALIAAGYAVFGPSPTSAMFLNALLGTALVGAVHACALQLGASRRQAFAAGLLMALSPTLVLYTAALMTEAVAAALLLLLTSFALALRRHRAAWPRLLLGAGGSLLVLVRPQLLPVLPALGAVAVAVPSHGPRLRGALLRLRGALEVLLVALVCCLPWTLRNCAKMDRCVFVSANGGWNLLIGTLPEGRGTFAPVVGAAVPAECRDVFGEAAKDRCFGQAGARRIRAAPLDWLALAPQKWGQLFNHGAVASAYLQASNPRLVSDRSRRAIAAVETAYARLLLLAACLGALRAAKTKSTRATRVLTAALALSPWAYAAQLGLLAALGGEGPSPGRRPLGFLGTCVLALTLATHLIFFGAPRYGLVWLPWLALLAFVPWNRENPETPSSLLTGTVPADDNFRSSLGAPGCR